MTPAVVKTFPTGNADRVEVLNQLKAMTGNLVPAAIRLDANTASFEWIEGDVPVTEATLPDNALEQVGAVVANLHRAGRTFPPSWGLRLVSQLPDTVAALKDSATALGLAFGLDADAPEWTMTWTHGDIAPANVVFRNDWQEVVGVIDWEFMAWDLPILDVAHALWRTAGWSAWKTGEADWNRRRRRTAGFLRGYRWTGRAENIVIALHFLLGRRVEVISAAEQAAPGTLPPDWTEELDRCSCDIAALVANSERYYKLAVQPELP